MYAGLAISSEAEDAMNDLKAQLARWIDEDREKIVGFLTALNKR